MRFGIIAALDKELRYIRKQMNRVQTAKVAGLTYHIGELYGSEVVAVVCSVGKVNAAICATLLLDHFKTDCVINIGIAGATDPRLHVLDVVLSSEAAYHDTDAVMLNYFPFQNSFQVDADLLKLGQYIVKKQGEKNFKYFEGKIATGDEFVSAQESKNDIIKRCSPMCVEMEGAAVAHVAHTFRKPFLIIRTMSDTADNQAENTYDNFIDLAAARSASIIIAMIRAYPKGEWRHD